MTKERPWKNKHQGYNKRSPRTSRRQGAKAGPNAASRPCSSGPCPLLQAQDIRTERKLPRVGEQRTEPQTAGAVGTAAGTHANHTGRRLPRGPGTLTPARAPVQGRASLPRQLAQNLAVAPAAPQLRHRTPGNVMSLELSSTRMSHALRPQFCALKGPWAWPFPGGWARTRPQEQAPPRAGPSLATPPGHGRTRGPLSEGQRLPVPHLGAQAMLSRDANSRLPWAHGMCGSV